MGEMTDQLELFELPRAENGSSRVAPIGTFQLRHDHAVLLAISGLIAISVVFASGVERGKQLARVDRPWMPREMAVAQAPTGSTTPSSTETTSHRSLAAPSGTATDSAEPAGRASPRTGAVTPAINADESSAPAQKDADEPTAKPATPGSPAKPAGARSRYAIQVVTYTQPKLARAEMERLRSQGEQAFLVTKPGRVVLCVGPFPSKEHATAKLASLKRQYQDCFVKTL